MDAPFNLTPKTAPSSDITHTIHNDAGTTVVTAHKDSTLRIWNQTADTCDLKAVLTTPHAPSDITGLAHAPDLLPFTVATAGSDGLCVVYTLRGVDVANVCVLRDAHALTDVAFSETGLLATLGAGALRVYTFEASRWALQAAVDVEAASLSFAPGAAFIAAGAHIVRRTGAEWEWEVAVSLPDPETAACVDWARSGFIGVGRRNGDVEIWVLRQGELNQIATLHGDAHVQRMQWDRVGGLLATVHDDGVIRTWGRRLGDGWEWCLRDKLEVRSAS